MSRSDHLAITDVRAAVFTVPTDRPESDGTLEWDRTLEAPMPAKVNLEQARNFALSLARGEPDRIAIGRIALGPRVRELV